MPISESCKNMKAFRFHNSIVEIEEYKRTLEMRGTVYLLRQVKRQSQVRNNTHYST